MKKVVSVMLASAVIFGCACSLNAQNPTDGNSDRSSGNGNTNTRITQIEFDYPDQLKYFDGGTVSFTLYKCGACYYYCVDGGHAWAKLCGGLPFETEDAEFVHVEADVDLAYGGIAGYWGNFKVRKIKDERRLTLDEVADCRILELYDAGEGAFFGARLIVKDDRNYLIVRDSLNKYRLYDNQVNLLCTYDTVMAAAAYLDDDADHTIEYSNTGCVSFYVMRIGDVYYAYSRYAELNSWKPLINMQFENKPIGFELEDGQVMEVDSASVYKVNGGKAGYVDVPMFESMKNTEQIGYSVLSDKAAYKHWEEVSSYENGRMYRYSYSLDDYLIFYLDDEFYVYYENGCDIESDEFIGRFSTADEINTVIGR